MYRRTNRRTDDLCVKNASAGEREPPYLRPPVGRPRFLRHAYDDGAPAGLACRRGLTLIELLIAMSIMAMVIGTLGAVARGVQLAFEYTEGHGTATQHARVVLDRIARHVENATANEQFPGFLVVPDVDGGLEFPDTLVVWHPSGAPANPNGLPRFSELVIFTPHREVPSQLLEITVPFDNRTVPPTHNLAQWRSELNSIRGSWHSQSYALTGLVRMCRVPGSSGNGRWRGAVRFRSDVRPSEAEWAQYKNGELDWLELAWIQGIYGSQTGLRQASMQIELQLMPGGAPALADENAHQPIPFFGAASLVYQLPR